MDPLRVAAGALTGLVVGMTGVGGGALMTPILLLMFGTAPLTAVGTDLWFAALTKVAVSGLHLRTGLIDWQVVARLWAGSLPASVLTVWWMAGRRADAGTLSLVTAAIGVAVVLSAMSLLASGRRGDRHRLQMSPGTVPGVRAWESAGTVLTGAGLGLVVTLTSVGAGALGAVALYRLYPQRLTPTRLVATDIAHAIPLALCAGLGHLTIHGIDGPLLRDLLAGSVPAALVGAMLSSRVSHRSLRVALGVVLLVVGLLMVRDAIG